MSSNLVDLVGLHSSLFEEREKNPDGTTSCGIFIPLPYNLAKDFPDKKEKDDSPPHLTLLFAGDLSSGQYHHLVKIVRRLARLLKPFEADLSYYSEFTNHEGEIIAHMKPSYAASSKLAALHGLLRRAIEHAGIPLQHSYGPDENPAIPYEIQFKAHATLAYQNPLSPLYDGPKPTGSWRVTELECWGHEKIRVPLGRNKYDQPIGLRRQFLTRPYPRAVPNPAPMKEDKLPGGLADKSKPSDFDSKELARGTRVELEHTKDLKLAREIAMDHLKEDPKYYQKLKKVHHESTFTVADVLNRAKLEMERTGLSAAQLLRRAQLEATTSLKGYERHPHPGGGGSNASGALSLETDPRYQDALDKAKKGKSKKLAL